MAKSEIPVWDQGPQYGTLAADAVIARASAMFDVEPDPMALTRKQRREAKRARNNVKAVAVRALRDAMGVCINGATHGPRTEGVCCHRCRLVHRHGITKATEMLKLERESAVQ